MFDPARSFALGALRAGLFAAACGLALGAAAEDAAPAATPAPQAAPSTVGTHPDIARAVAYSVPPTTCVEPELRRATHNPGWMERNQRASKRYVNCLVEYQAQLFADFQFLRDSVRHGATMDQARAIAANLGKVADAIKALKGKGVELAQDQARVIATGLSGNRSMPGAESHQ